MSTPNADAPPTPPTTKKPDDAALRRPVLDWHARKNGKRDILCIAALSRGWDYRQEPRTIGEVILTEPEYDAAMAEATTIWEAARKTGGRRAIILAHPKSLLAIVVKRPTGAECDRIVSIMQDDKLSEDETAAALRDDMVQRMLWPLQGSDAMAALMEDAPMAFGHIFPKMLLSYCGADTQAAKKLG